MAANSPEHVAPSIHKAPSRLPVMANQYTSNEMYISKRANAIPAPITYSVKSNDRVNKFRTDVE